MGYQILANGGTGLNLVATLQRASDGYFWDNAAAEWAEDPSFADRAVELTEDPAGVYTGTTADGMGTATVTITLHDTDNDNEPVGSMTVLVVNGTNAEPAAGDERRSTFTLPARPEQTVRAEAKIRHPADVTEYAFSFRQVVPTGETIAEILSVTVQPAGALDVEGEHVNADPFEEDDGTLVGAGLGVLATVSGGAAPRNATVTISVELTDGQRRGGVFPFLVRET